jgi:hypothetical protein
MNPASGPDYLRMEKYNTKPHPPPGDAEKDRTDFLAWKSQQEARIAEIIETKKVSVPPVGTPGNPYWKTATPPKASVNISKMRELTRRVILKSYKRSNREPPTPTQLNKAVEILIPVAAQKPLPPAIQAIPNGHHAPVDREKFNHALECQICGLLFLKKSSGDNQHITRHHIRPRTEWDRLGSLYVTVWLCHACHTALHVRYTNSELANCPWEETRFLMRNTIPARAS